MDEFSRYAVRVSVAQICQAVGWTKIQSTPLEVLTDFMQEYILSIGRLANNYATLLGHSEPNLSHVSLAFKDMNISFNELKDYITHFESGAALEVPKYPIQKESHLNHLKPGSREVLTRPVHIHDHLPPMFPELEGSLLYHSPTYDSLPSDRLSPVNDLKIKPEPSDSFYDEWNETPNGEDIRPLRELSSVLMTTSGFLSSAREGKLPEVRNLIPSLPETDESKLLSEPGKTKDKENRFKEELATEKIHAPPERKTKHKKHKKKSHQDNPNSKSNKVDDVFFNNPKQTSGSIKKSFKKELKLSKKVHSSSKEISSVSSNPGNLLHKDYKDLKEHRNHLKHKSLDDTKDNNLSLIDLFSVPQVNGNEKYNYDTDNIIDVVNSSPINNIEYSNNSSPLLELDDPGFLPQGSSSSPFFQFDRKTPDFVTEINNLEVKTENKTSEVSVDSTSINLKCDNETPSFKQKSSPDLKHEFLSPGVKFESPTFDFERNSSGFDYERPSPKEKTQETILDNKIDCSGSDIPPQDLNTLLNQSMSSRSKKKKKKDKKNKTKDKNILFAEGDTKDKLKVKKKKKDGKKDKNIDINNKCLVGTNVDLEMPQKKMKLEINCNIQKEPKVKQSSSSSLLFHSSENYSIAKINESQHSIPNSSSIPSHLSTSVSESPVGGGISHLSASVVAPSQSPAPPGLTVGSQGVGHLTTFAGHYANATSHSTSSASLSVCTDYVSHTSGSAGTASHTSTSLCLSTSQAHKEPHRKSKNEVRKKEKKEKRREKESMKHLSEDLFTFEPLKRVKEKDKRKSASPLPKITFKLGPSPPKINSEPKHQKIIIKPVVKTEKHTNDSSNKHQPQNLPSNASSHQADERFFPQPAAQAFGHTGDCPAPLAQQPAVAYDPNQIWICPACNRPDDGSPMIACDKCDLWFHWVCVGIFEAIEGDWYCKTCLIKKEQNKIRDKKKKQKKKKI